MSEIDSEINAERPINQSINVSIQNNEANQPHSDTCFISNAATTYVQKTHTYSNF